MSPHRFHHSRVWLVVVSPDFMMATYGHGPIPLSPNFCQFNSVDATGVVVIVAFVVAVLEAVAVAVAVVVVVVVVVTVVVVVVVNSRQRRRVRGDNQEGVAGFVWW